MSDAVTLVWVPQEDLFDVWSRIQSIGTMVSEEKENPDETGEPYRLVRNWSLPDGLSAEEFWSEVRRRHPDDIRLAIPTRKLSDGDSPSVAVRRALGLDNSL